jgi:U6 snRNA-associated Sm-like protein LSm6
VIVRLISGVDYRGARNPQFSISPLLTDCRVFVGVLSCLDGYMNIALEQTEEHVNGAVTNRYGDAFIRGNNGAFDSFISAY